MTRLHHQQREEEEEEEEESSNIPAPMILPPPNHHSLSLLQHRVPHTTTRRRGGNQTHLHALDPSGPSAAVVGGVHCRPLLLGVWLWLLVGERERERVASPYCVKLCVTITWLGDVSRGVLTL